MSFSHVCTLCMLPQQAHAGRSHGALPCSHGCTEISSITLSTPPPLLPQAVGQALATLTSLVAAQASPSVEFLQRVVLVSSTTLFDLVAQLAAGEMTLEQFEAAASPSALQVCCLAAAWCALLGCQRWGWMNADWCRPN